MSTPQGAPNYVKRYYLNWVDKEPICSDEDLPITDVNSPDPFAQLFIEIQSSLLNLTDDNYSEEQQKILANFNKIINFPNPPSPREANEQFVFMLLARIYLSHYHKRSLYDRIAKLLNPNKDKFEKAINLVREEKKRENKMEYSGFHEALKIIYGIITPDPIEQLIMDDELQALQNAVLKEVKIESTIPDIVAALKLAAICGSVECFRYLWLIHENDETHYGLFDAAIFGGNYEIIHFLEQNGYEYCKSLPSATNAAIIAHRNEIAYWLFREKDIDFSFYTAMNEYNLQATIWADLMLDKIPPRLLMNIMDIPILSHIHFDPHGAPFHPTSMNMLFSNAGVEAAAAYIKFYNFSYDQIETINLVLENSPEPIQFLNWVFEQKFDVFYIRNYKTIFHCIVKSYSVEVLIHLLNLLKKVNTDQAKIQNQINETANGFTMHPLIIAAKKGDEDKIKVLIQNGANINATFEGHSFLFHLLDSHPENTDFALELLKKFQKKFMPDPTIPSLIRVMAENGRLNIFEYYIKYFEVDLNYPITQGLLRKIDPTGNEVMEYLKENKLL